MFLYEIEAATKEQILSEKCGFWRLGEEPFSVGIGNHDQETMTYILNTIPRLSHEYIFHNEALYSYVRQI